MSTKFILDLAAKSPYFALALAVSVAILGICCLRCVSICANKGTIGKITFTSWIGKFTVEPGQFSKSDATPLESKEKEIEAVTERRSLRTLFRRKK